METILVNDWINLNVTRKGATVQRKYAGLDTLCDPENKVLYCIVKYWERELYPNGEPIKTVLKTYTLTDLERQEWVENIGTEEAPINVVKYREQRLVLSGFVANLGNAYIIAPTRGTIANTVTLPLETEENYPLHRDTRPILTQE